MFKTMCVNCKNLIRVTPLDELIRASIKVKNFNIPLNLV